MILSKASFFILFLEIISYTFCSAEQIVNNYICETDFCERYVDTTGCGVLEESCRVQNATMNGIILPSQTPCSCCESCLEHLSEGDDCTLGLIGAPVPTTVCGPDLTCTRGGADDEHATCHYRMGTTCLNTVNSYQEGIRTGNLGHLMVRPQCNSLGDFNAFQCIPGQICYCVDKQGNRIFGESLNRPGMSILMRCQCSREETNLRMTLNLRTSNYYIRCNDMGSYERLQCIGDKCICVDQHTGSPTSPMYNRTDLNDLQSDWKCFDGTEDDLVRPCELKRQQLAKNPPPYLTNSDFATMCQPDGWFHRVQRANETHYYCADKFGAPIAVYGQLVTEGQTPPINCNCARVVDLLKKNNRIEFPQCCPNGNYKKINCRRGYCYCVDVNGQQTSEEVAQYQTSLLTCSDEFQADSECN